MDRKALAVLAIAVAVAGYWWWKDGELVPPTPPVERPPTLELIDRYEIEVAGHPEDAETFALLGKLYLQYARETNDLEGYLSAEKRLRTALAGLPPSPRVQGTLAEVLLAQNRFGEALEVALQAFEGDRGDLRALTVIGDAQTKLGRYDEAEKAFEALRAVRPVPAILARLGAIAETRGDLDRARVLVEEALARATAEARDPADAAWFLTQTCLIHVRRGDLASARPLCEKATGLREDDFTLSGLARMRAAEERFAEAIQLYETLASRRDDPIVHDALADLFEVTGDAERANNHAERAIAIAESAPIRAVHRRLLSLLYARREGGAERALELARQDLAERADPHAWGTLAFALLANRQPSEAAEASGKALALAPSDAKLHYHAGLIQRALGDESAARRHVERALALDPRFSVTEAPEARALLGDLRR